MWKTYDLSTVDSDINRHKETMRKDRQRQHNKTTDAGRVCMYSCMSILLWFCLVHAGPEVWLRHVLCIKLIAFEMACEDCERRESPVVSRLKIAFYALHKRGWTGFSPCLENFAANSNPISFSKCVFPLFCHCVWLCMYELFYVQLHVGTMFVTHKVD